MSRIAKGLSSRKCSLGVSQEKHAPDRPSPGITIEYEWESARRTYSIKLKFSSGSKKVSISADDNLWGGDKGCHTLTGEVVNIDDEHPEWVIQASGAVTGGSLVVEDSGGPTGTMLMGELSLSGEHVDVVDAYSGVITPADGLGSKGCSVQ
eukprot:m51a1_g2423 hypothetical protein (151) ;mRNA; r:811532-812050